MSFRRLPGFRGVPTGRDAVRLMQKMGMNLEELPGVLEVQIKTEDKTIVVENPTVTVIKMQGQSMFQVSGGVVKEVTMAEQLSEQRFEEDVKLVAEQTGRTVDEARKALQETGGDLAKAIIKLQAEGKP